MTWKIIICKMKNRSIDWIPRILNLVTQVKRKIISIVAFDLCFINFSFPFLYGATQQNSLYSFRQSYKQNQAYIASENAFLPMAVFSNINNSNLYRVVFVPKNFLWRVNSFLKKLTLLQSQAKTVYYIDPDLLVLNQVFNFTVVFQKL